MPVIRRLLVEDAEDDQMIVAVTDAGGRMLWVEGDSRLRSQAAGMHFVEGARWAEDVVGTNAPGTALAVDHAVQIYGSEHFRRPVQPWSCSAAPVHDPLTGPLLGAIDVTGGDHVASPHVLTLVRATVAAVESELRWQHREQVQRGTGRRPPPLQRLAPRLEVLGRERARLTLPSGPLELSLRHSELLAAARRGRRRGRGPHHRPAGRRVPPAATPRRSPSGPSCPGCAGWSAPTSSAPGPTGCCGRVDTDLDQVRRLLARGAVGSALERYPGAVLPGSHAPGVAVARERVSALLRQAVLRSRRPELLLRYAQLPEARDDVVVWQTCLDWLPPSSPRARPRPPRTCCG